MSIYELTHSLHTNEEKSKTECLLDIYPSSNLYGCYKLSPHSVSKLSGSSQLYEHRALEHGRAIHLLFWKLCNTYSMHWDPGATLCSTDLTLTVLVTTIEHSGRGWGM